MALALAAALFGVFVTNIGLGAFGGTQFLDDVQEMLMLFTATIAFVAAILRAEAKKKNQKSK